MPTLTAFTAELATCQTPQDSAALFHRAAAEMRARREARQAKTDFDAAYDQQRLSTSHQQK